MTNDKPELDLDRLSVERMALLAEVGLDPDKVLQWPSVARRGRANVLSYEHENGEEHELTVSPQWVRRYLEARGHAQ